MKRFVAVLVALALCVPLAACRAPSGGHYTFDLIVKEPTMDFWVHLNEGAQAAAREYGITVNFLGPDVETNY